MRPSPELLKRKRGEQLGRLSRRKLYTGFSLCPSKLFRKMISKRDAGYDPPPPCSDPQLCQLARISFPRMKMIDDAMKQNQTYTHTRIHAYTVILRGSCQVARPINRTLATQCRRASVRFNRRITWLHCWRQQQGRGSADPDQLRPWARESGALQSVKMSASSFEIECTVDGAGCRHSPASAGSCRHVVAFTGMSQPCRAGSVEGRGSQGCTCPH